MANWFVSPLVDKLMEKVIKTLFHYVQDQFRWQTGMKKELKNLRENHLMIQAVLSAARRAENMDQNSAFNKWIWKLRDAIDEVDDLLDELEYKNYQQHDFIQKCIQFGERLLKTDPDLMRLEESVQKLDRISGNVTTFLHLFESIKQEQRELEVELHTTRETGSFPTNDLIGRDKDKESVIEWLRKPSIETTTSLYRNISLLSIVGHGGMGKTTLLQHIYEDEIMEEFDLKMWVCVSDNFNVKKVIADMLESLHDNRPSLQSLHALQKSLKSKVMSKKFLLVLDDLWDKEKEAILYGKWGDVLAPLANGDLGSKILITTRADSVASMIAKVIRKEKEVLKLEGLEEDKCLQLLTTHAFTFGENPDDHKKLISITRELVKKLHGSPLAAKVMGGVLNSSLDERHWRNVLNSSLDFDDIFPILKLSYIFLPEHLQNCFSFCSIFEQDHFFDKDDLIRMWIAVGFIQPPHNNQGEALTLEDIGNNYFDVLIKKSFFNKVSDEGYKMHDLLHELAQFVSTQECCKFVGDEMSLFLKIPKTIRHLSVETSNPEVLKKVRRFKNLRTLHITDEYDSNLVDILIEIFQVIKSIRLLYLKYSFELKMMPEEVGYLHHLRYLRFSVLNVKLLPRSISSLYHLQFIIFNDYEQNSFSNDYFPRDMNNLFNLRYLSCLKLNFPGIRKLKYLQELKKFDNKNENGYRIEELEHLNELRILGIMNLEDVRDTKEAFNAKLCDKRKLVDLSLHWDHLNLDNEDGELDERVLDNLQPHNYLKTLQIDGYMGARSAIWMKEAHTINNIEAIVLSECFQWEILPPFGQLPFLKSLRLWKMPKVKGLENKFHGNDMCCCVFPSLETLYLRGMEALVDWFDASVVDSLFPCLSKLEIYQCPNLQELPYLPPKLQTLKIKDIRWKTLNCCSSISKSIPLPLQILDVRHCPNITSISFEGEIGSKLEKLIIDDLQSLQFLPSSLTNMISSIEFVEMKMLPQLQEYPYLPLPLKKMKIKKLMLHPEETIKLTIDNENDCRIEELEYMNETRFLIINNLKNVRDAEGACIAKLCDKRRLIHLSLNWRMGHFYSDFDHADPDIADCDLDEKVLDNLQPHNYLKTLKIYDYMGARSAIWMKEAYTINNLEEIKLSNCLNWEILPPFAQLPFLKTLKLSCMQKVKGFENKFHGNDMPGSCVFPSLETLQFIGMRALVDWFDASLVDTLFPCLTKLGLYNCPNLQELPYLPPKLESLQLENIGWKTLNCCSISKSIPLQTLDVYHCPNMTCISFEGEIEKLKKLTIEHLPSLQFLPSSLANISSLKFLKLAELPQLQQYPDPPPSLKEFYFS